MSAQPDSIRPPPETYAVPLRFGRHNFGAHCYNTLNCRVLYDNNNFTRLAGNKRMPAPRTDDYPNSLSAGYLGIRNFPPPADVLWTSLDGVRHEVSVDLAAIFHDQLIWHKVPRSDMADFYRGPVAGAPDIMLEVNDRTLSVYMRMLVPTRTEQIPGNKLSYARDDLFLVWTRTY